MNAQTTSSSIVKSDSGNTGFTNFIHTRFRFGAVWLLSALMLSLPAAGSAQDFLYETNNGTITITGYNGPGGAVIIPNTISNLPVTSIASFAFADEMGSTNIAIPDSITNIGSSAFSRCVNLAGVTLSTNLTGIPEAAFFECTSLVTVTIPKSVTAIEINSFSGCTSLKSLTIPDNVTSIGSQAFSECTSLTTIGVGATNPVYSSQSGVLFDKARTTLIQYPGGKAGNYTVPSTVNNIAVLAFASSAALTRVTIPNSVTTIGNGAFSSCTAMTNVSLGTGLTNLGSGVFSGCTRLTSVVIPNSVTSIGDAAFSGCARLANVTIPNSVTNIGDYAFSACARLPRVTIGNGVTNIGNYAFQFCTGLTNVTIGTNVATIGSGAFYSCTSLSSVTIPDKVVSLGNLAFASCTGLLGIYFNGNAPALGSNVFAGDNQATVYYLPGTFGWGTTFGGRPAVALVLQVPTGDANFGIRSNQFGFTINWVSGSVVVVEVCTNLASPVWTPLKTNILTSGSIYFGDSGWTNHSSRFLSPALSVSFGSWPTGSWQAGT